MMGANPGRGRIALVLLLFFLLALAGGVISMMMGSVEIPLQEILGASRGRAARTRRSSGTSGCRARSSRRSSASTSRSRAPSCRPS